MRLGGLSRGRTALLAICAAAGVLLAADRVFGLLYPPGEDSKLHAGRFNRAGHTWLALTKDTRQDSTLLDLTIATQPQWSGVFRAELTTGDTLAVHGERVRPGVWRAIVASPSRAAVRRAKFMWPNGVDLLVTTIPDAGMDSLVDWKLTFVERPSDSAAQARNRDLWRSASTTLLALCVVGAVVGAIPRDSRSDDPVTALECVRRIIEGVEGDDEAETRRMRSMLCDVLIEGASLRETVRSARSTLGFAEGSRLWFRAQSEFIARHERLVHDLSEFAVPLATYRQSVVASFHPYST